MKTPPSFTSGNLWILLVLLMMGAAIAHPGHDGESAGSVEPQLVSTTSATTPDASTKASVSIVVDGLFCIIRSNGLPDHQPGTFPRRGNPNTI